MSESPHGKGVPYMDAQRKAFLIESVRAVEACAPLGSHSVIALRARRDWVAGEMLARGWAQWPTGWLKAGRWLVVVDDALPASDDGLSPLEGCLFDGLAFVEPDRLQAAISDRLRGSIRSPERGAAKADRLPSGERGMSRDDDMRLNALDPRNVIARQRRVIEAVARALGAYDEAGNIEGWVHDVEQFILDCVPSIADMRPDVYVSASCPAPDDAPEGVTVGFDADGRFEIRRD